VFHKIPTPRGYSAPEITSALQKAIRRSDDQQAVFWAVELDRAGYTKYLWRRLLIITSEDIGLANPELPAQIWALHQMHTELAAWKNKNGPERLPLVHAVLLMARSPKSRMVDHALHVEYSINDRKFEVPDEALDMHTRRGRQMGHGDDHWYAEAATLVNKIDLDDPWEDESKRIQYNPPAEQPLVGRNSKPKSDVFDDNVDTSLFDSNTDLSAN
jgi:replication-associated recombination protein RarA